MLPAIPTSLPQGTTQPEFLAPPAWFPRMASPSEAVQVSDDTKYLGHEFRAGYALLTYLGDWDVEKVRYAVTQLQMGVPWLAAWLAQVTVRHPYVFIPLRQRAELPNGADCEVTGGDRGAARVAKEGFAAEMRRARPVFPDFERGSAMMGYQWIQAIWDTSTAPWGLTLKPWPAASTYQDALGQWWALAVEGRTAMHHGDGKWFFVGSGVTPCNNGAIVCLGEQFAGGRCGMRDEAAVMANAGLIAPVVEAGQEVKPGDEVGFATVKAVEDFVARKAGIVLFHGSKMGKFPGVDEGTAKLFSNYLDRNEAICRGAICGTPGPKATGGVYISPWLAAIEQSIVRASLGQLAWALSAIGTVYGRYGWDLLPEKSPGYRWNLPDPGEAQRLTEQLERRAKAVAEVKSWQDSGLAPTEDDFLALEKAAGGIRIPRPASKHTRALEWHVQLGVVSPNEVRARDLELPSREGGNETILQGAAKLAKTAETANPGDVAPPPTPESQPAQPSPGAA